MARHTYRRTLRVDSVPWGVVAWIDHDRHGNLLLLNASVFTAEQEEAITAVLAGGNYTARQVLNALATRGG